MTLLVLGINHKVAPLALREQLLFLPPHRTAAYTSLLQQPRVQGALLLSTCHRSEIYLQVVPASSLALEKQVQQLLGWWSGYHAVPQILLQERFYWFGDQEAVAHLMRVVAGVDSWVVGESQIAGQVKQAYHEAQQHQKLPPNLDRLFQRAFYTAKQIRRETGLGRQALSIATVACRLVRQQIPVGSAASILLIGSGATNALVATQLYQHAVGQLILAARNRERATPLARSVKATLIPLEALPQWLPSVDVVISATSSPGVILDQALVAQALQQRVATQEPLLLLDLAVPRDLAAEIAQLAGAQLYSLDDLQTTLRQQLDQQDAAVLQAEATINQAAEQFMGWLNSTPRTAMIRQFREAGHQRRCRLEQHALAALQQGIAAEQVVQQLAYQLTNQLLHQSTQLLQWLIQQPDVLSRTPQQHDLERSSVASKDNPPVDRKFGS